MPRNISNSEVTAWLTCRQQYYFAHYLNVEPLQMGVPLYRGNVGHEAFQRYAEARIDGKSHDSALTFADKVFINEMSTQPQYMDTILQTKSIFDKYMAYHRGWPEWRLLSVEQRYDLKLNDSMNITMRYDVMVEDIQTGKTLIGDYKYTYDFWTPDEHNLNGQMPKYISVMNANGYKVDGGFLEELRTRKLSERNGNASDPKQLWRRTKYFPSNHKKVAVIRQHVAAGLEITRYWDASDADREAMTIPVLNKHGGCKVCNFKEVCAAKLDGGDTEYMLKTMYKPNTYGYNNATEADKVKELL